MSVPYFFASRFCAAMVLIRAMSRRASRSRECSPAARGALETQIEALLLQIEDASSI